MPSKVRSSGDAHPIAASQPVCLGTSRSFLQRDADQGWLGISSCQTREIESFDILELPNFLIEVCSTFQPDQIKQLSHLGQIEAATIHATSLSLIIFEDLATVLPPANRRGFLLEHPAYVMCDAGNDRMAAFVRVIANFLILGSHRRTCFDEAFKTLGAILTADRVEASLTLLRRHTHHAFSARETKNSDFCAAQDVLNSTAVADSLRFNDIHLCARLLNAIQRYFFTVFEQEQQRQENHPLDPASFPFPHQAQLLTRLHRHNEDFSSTPRNGLPSCSGDAHPTAAELEQKPGLAAAAGRRWGHRKTREASAADFQMLTLQCAACERNLCDGADLAFFHRVNSDEGTEVHLMLKPEMPVPDTFKPSANIQKGSSKTWLCECHARLADTRPIAVSRAPMIAFKSTAVILGGQRFRGKKSKWPTLYKTPPFNQIEVRGRATYRGIQQ
jgi:hypothetical protein